MKNLKPIGEPFKTYDEYVQALIRPNHPLHAEAERLKKERWGINDQASQDTSDYRKMHDRIVLSNNRD